MIIFILLLLGLCFGSFVNALVWRLHEQAKSKKQKAKSRLSIIRGRSMCIHCRHSLAPKDLLPVTSWIILKGKCRYCQKPISWQYPLIEALTAGLFVASYIFWPLPLTTEGLVLLILWLVFIVGFVSLAVYDLRWQLLPNKLIYPLIGLGLIQVFLQATVFGEGLQTVAEAAWGVLIASGTFYLLFQVSGGHWIGGGDVKLGIVLGLILGGPLKSLLMLFLAALLGSLVTLPLLVAGRTKRSAQIPFGPFLLLATIILQFFGAAIISWYKTHLLLNTL